MYKIAVIGDKESILVFKAFGTEVFVAEEENVIENEKLIKRLAREGYAVILITEQVASKLSEVLDYYSRESLPAIMLIPSTQGSNGLAQERMRKNVEKAVGMDIL